MNRITIIIVLYKCKLHNSKTINSLIDIFKYNKYSLVNIDIIIYENGFSANTSLNLPFEYEYVNDKNNMGLASAYNYALKNALLLNSDFIGLFDQDTTLPVTFFDSISENLSKYKNNIQVVAFVPKLAYEGKLFSPSRVIFGGIHRPIDPDFVGIGLGEVCAVGSCTFLRVNFFHEIGGFNSLFPVDGLDRWIFYICHARNKQVAIFPIKVNHDLSILDYDKFVTEDRYIQILKYENKFISLYKSNFEFLIFKFRLILRVFKLYFFCKNKNYSKITLYHLMNR